MWNLYQIIYQQLLLNKLNLASFMELMRLGEIFTWYQNIQVKRLESGKLLGVDL